MKKFCTLLILALFWVSSSKEAFGVETHNNKFGIHLAVPAEEDLQDTAALVNSSGGDWGYVTVVIEENDRDLNKWQNTFDYIRRLHLIPIVRIATSFEGENWRQPAVEDAQGWADFLGSLNWVIKNRYVVVFNEPNFFREWGGKIDPENYGQVVLAFAKALKEKSPDFFLMMSGFNATAPHKLPEYEKEDIFLRKVFSILPGGINDFFADFDGWASHSYEDDIYMKELAILKKLGLKKNLPVFITETGWPHAEGLTYQKGMVSETVSARAFKSYFQQVIRDPKVMAVTPFILNYQSEPFDHFSWRRPGNPKSFYEQYGATQAIEKIKGEPVQEHRLIVTPSLPAKLIADSTYQISFSVRNEGQAIWDSQDGYRLELIEEGKGNFEYFFTEFSSLQPNHEQIMILFFKTGSKTGRFNFSLSVAKNEKVVSNLIEWHPEIIRPISISFKVNLFPKKKDEGNDFKILIYGPQEQVLFEKTDLVVKEGLGKVDDVRNIVIGEKYRIVLLKPYYLPRQEFLTIKEEKNEVVFKRMLPLDFNLDGKFSFFDLRYLVRKPGLFKLWWIE